MGKSSFDEIEKSLVSILNDTTAQLNKTIYTDANWTDGIKKALGDFGKNEKSFEVCTTGFPRCFEPEWLFDLVWYSSDEGYFTELVLACEIEWKTNIDFIRYDFEKLLVVKAKYRLMVYQAPSRNLHKQWNKEIHNAITRNKAILPDDRFLLACYDQSVSKFHFELIDSEKIKLLKSK